MTIHRDLTKISQITNNIFLSGIYPLEENRNLIKKLDIKYILACVDRTAISSIHDKIMIDNPNITILYIPYNDDVRQNLWTKNNNKINIVKYTASIKDFDLLEKQMNRYQNKYMIEIGYHFMNNAIDINKNVLVHCMAGISRSVSMVSYFLMKKYTINYLDAMKIIRNQRSIANPNFSFKLQLQLYQIKKDNYTESDSDNIIVKHQDYIPM